MIKRILLFASFQSILTFAAQCQWVNYQQISADGIRNGHVQKIVSTADQHLWFAVDSSLWMYTPDVRLWTPVQITGMPAPSKIQDLFVDQAGALWLGTRSHGAIRRDPQGNWQVFDTLAGMNGMNVQGITQDFFGHYWFATYDSGVCRWDGTTWTKYGIIDSIPESHYLTAFCDSQGRLWFGSQDSGIVLHNFSGWHRYKYGQGPIGNTVSHITEDHQQWIYLSGEHGVTVHLGGFWMHIGSGQNLPGTYAYAVEEINDSTLWVATDEGIGVWRSGIIDTMDSSSGLAENGVSALLQDANGRVWAGGESAGVSYYENWDWYAYQSSTGIASDQFTDAARDFPQGSVFSTNGGISRFNAGYWQTMTTLDGLPSDLVHAIEVDGGGNIWALFGIINYYIGVYDGSSWNIYNAPGDLARTDASCIHIDALGNLWVAYQAGSLVSRFNGSSWTHFDAGTEMNVLKMAHRNSDGIWLAGTHGISKFENGSWEHFSTVDGLPDNHATSLCTAPDGTLWASFSHYMNGGLATYDGSSWTIVSESIHTRYISSVLIDSYNRIWAVGSYTPGDTKVSCYDGTEWQYFSTSNGIEGELFTGLYEDAGGHIWALTADKGVNINSTLLSDIDQQDGVFTAPLPYPNPADQQFSLTINTGTAADCKLRLFDCTGREVHRAVYPLSSGQRNEIQVPCSELDSGLYFYSLTYSDKNFGGKILIAHF